MKKTFKAKTTYSEVEWLREEERLLNFFKEEYAMGDKCLRCKDKLVVDAHIGTDYTHKSILVEDGLCELCYKAVSIIKYDKSLGENLPSMPKGELKIMPDGTLKRG
jgi:hypothetical protein